MKIDARTIGWWGGAIFLLFSLSSQITQQAYTPGSLALDGILLVLLGNTIPDRWPFVR